MQDVFKPRAALIFRLIVGLLFGLGIAFLDKSFNALEAAQTAVWAKTLTSVLLLGSLFCGLAPVSCVGSASWSGGLQRWA